MQYILSDCICVPYFVHALCITLYLLYTTAITNLLESADAFMQRKDTIDTIRWSNGAYAQLRMLEKWLSVIIDCCKVMITIST